MATADELLSGSVADKTLIIDNDLRTIRIPSSVSNLGVESDDEVLRLKFKMPRYITGVDLSTFSIRINYANANNECDVYTVSDAAVGAETIMFSWLVGPNATKYKGTTRFIVCAVKLNSEGTIDKEYNTTIASLPVLEGLETNQRAVSKYSDLIEQWRAELFGIGDTEEANMIAVSEEQQAVLENKGAEVLATIPEDYTTAYNNSEEAVRTKGDAVVCSTQGEAITVSDSSDDHLRGLKVFGKTTQITTTGKNLIRNELYTMTTNGLTITVHPDKTFTVNGTATTGTFLTIHTDFNPGAGEYILSGCPSTGGVSKYILYMTDTENGFYAQDVGNGYKFTHPGDVAPDVRLAVYEGVTVNNALFKPMIRSASIEDTTYEPYSDGVASPTPEWPQELSSVENPQVDIYGKNLLDWDNVLDALKLGADSSGATLTVKDGSVSLSGTPTVNFVQANNWLTEVSESWRGKKMYLRATITGTEPYMIMYFKDDSNRSLGAASLTQTGVVEFTMPPTAAFVLFAFCLNKKTVNTECTAVYSDLYLGVEDTEYEEHKTAQFISVPYTLRGIPVSKDGNYTDPTGQQWICDEVDFERGVFVQRLTTKVLDGITIRPYQAAHNTGQNYCAVYPVDNAYNSPVMSNKYKFSPINWSNSDKTLYGIGTAIIINDSRFDSEDNISSIFGNELPEITYVLATPIETPLTQEEIAAFKALRSNCLNTTVLNDSGATMELKYNADTKTYLVNTITSILEGIENGSY